MLNCPRCRQSSALIRQDIIGKYLYCMTCSWQTQPKAPEQVREFNHRPDQCPRCRPVPYVIALHNAIRDVRRRRSEGEPVIHIAAQLGVSQRTIHRRLRQVAICGGGAPLCDSCASYPSAVSA